MLVFRALCHGVVVTPVEISPRLFCKSIDDRRLNQRFMGFDIGDQFSGGERGVRI